MDKQPDVNNALLERLEKVVESLQDNSKQDRIDEVLFEKIEHVNEKLDRHANDIKKGCERDIMLVDNRLRLIEKKMWTIAGALTIISFVVSPIGQRFVRGLTLSPQPSIMQVK